MADLKAQNTECDQKTLEYIHTNKTAKMFRCAAAMGAICGGANKKQYGSLCEYGLKIGLSFQIADDILDVTASSRQGCDRRQMHGPGHCRSGKSPADSEEADRRGCSYSQAVRQKSRHPPAISSQPARKNKINYSKTSGLKRCPNISSESRSTIFLPVSSSPLIR